MNQEFKYNHENQDRCGSLASLEALNPQILLQLRFQTLREIHDDRTVSLVRCQAKAKMKAKGRAWFLQRDSSFEKFSMED
jgi:hypothetical protein